MSGRDWLFIVAGGLTGLVWILLLVTTLRRPGDIERARGRLHRAIELNQHTA